jgi:thymidylate synthase (FAD)
MDYSAKIVGKTMPFNIDADNMEELIAYAARVSNPSNQSNHDTAQKLLAYCVKHKHWSVFETANFVVEIKAPRDITRQLLRHRSFTFQEFSQRYSDEIQWTEREFRRQDTKNRQNSLDNFDKETQEYLQRLCRNHIENSQRLYKKLRSLGVAKECCRGVLPEGYAMSTMYVNGTVRSWLHYLDVRDDEGVTQLEHVQLARAIKDSLAAELPQIMQVWETNRNEMK